MILPRSGKVFLSLFSSLFPPSWCVQGALWWDETFSFPSRNLINQLLSFMMWKFGSTKKTFSSSLVRWEGFWIGEIRIVRFCLSQDFLFFWHCSPDRISRDFHNMGLRREELVRSMWHMCSSWKIKDLWINYEFKLYRKCSTLPIPNFPGQFLRFTLDLTTMFYYNYNICRNILHWVKSSFNCKSFPTCSHLVFI